MFRLSFYFFFFIYLFFFVLQNMTKEALKCNRSIFFFRTEKHNKTAHLFLKGYRVLMFVCILKKTHHSIFVV